MSIAKDKMLRMVENSEPNAAVQVIKEAIDVLVFCHVTELEESLKCVIPVIIRTMEQIYTKNNVMVQSNKETVLDAIRANFQIALNLMDISNEILQCVMKNENVTFSVVPSVPVNVAQILFLTFEHCKNSQKMYSSYHKAVTEILDLFRKTQEVHAKFLNFLDTNLSFDFSNENEIIAYRENIILKISKTLFGTNMKSMADNWKSFIALRQKSSGQNVTICTLSPAIRILTEEINNNLLAICEIDSSDLKKASQSFKVTGFLVKVVLKLLEPKINIEDDFEDVLKFWIMIYSWHGGVFRTNRFADEIVDAVNTVYNLCSESISELLFRDFEFLNQFCLLHEDFASPNQSFAFLRFTNALIKELPTLKNHPEVFSSFSLIPLLHLAFNLPRKCFLEYFCDYNSDFYEEFVINVSVAVLLLPHQFPDIENMLLDCVLDNNIWATLMAIDVWSSILRYASEDVRRSTLTTLIKLIENLKLGIFQQTSTIIFLKVLTQRVLKTLSPITRNEVITKYNPTSHFSVWKILNLRNIPLSHRYYVEFLLCDIRDKMDFIEEPDCSVSNLLTLMEHLDIISYTNFNNLEIKEAQIIPFIMRLWSFDMCDVSPSNNFFKYFIYKLTKVTMAVNGELSGESFVLVLSQLKALLSEELYKLLTCSLLQLMAKRNFNNFHEKNTLFSLMSSLLQTLLCDKNGIVVQACLESFLKISNSNSYESVVYKVSTCSPVVKKMMADFTQRKASEMKYTVKYFDKIRNFTNKHKCSEWSDTYQPLTKKIKIDSDVNIIIDNLNNDTKKLLNIANKVQINERQRMDIKDVINKLETVLK